MKHILLVAGLVVVLVSGSYILYTQLGVSEAEDVDTTDDAARTASGVVTAIDTEAVMLDGPVRITIATSDGAEVIAVPSMGLPLCAAAAHIADAFAVAVGDQITVTGSVNESYEIVPCESMEHQLEITSAFVDEQVGYQFNYHKGPDGYVVVPVEQSPSSAAYVAGVTVYPRTAYEEFMRSDDAREGPLAVSVMVYTNTENESAAVWALRHPQESNSELAQDEVREAVVGGANAVAYRIDGLYPADTYVVAHGGYVYVFSGMYDSADAPIRTEFQFILDTIAFIPTADQR